MSNMSNYGRWTRAASLCFVYDRRKGEVQDRGATATQVLTSGLQGRLPSLSTPETSLGEATRSKERLVEEPRALLRA
jgi:hypothetical protein